MEDELLAAALAASLAAEGYNENEQQQQQQRGSGSGSQQQQPYSDNHGEPTHYPGERSVFTGGSGASATAPSHNDTNTEQQQHRRRSPNKGSKYLDLINSTTESVALLNEVINASTSPQELRDNEIAEEVAQQLRGYQSKIVSAIDVALTSHPEVSE